MLYSSFVYLGNYNQLAVSLGLLVFADPPLIRPGFALDLPIIRLENSRLFTGLRLAALQAALAAQRLQPNGPYFGCIG